MVKTRKPLLAHQASGSIADVLNFSNWKGRSTVRKKPKPRDPKTRLQLSTRAMMRFLGNAWSIIPTANRETWEPQARADNVSTYNAYLKANLQRWRRYKYPTQSWPATEVLAWATHYRLFLTPRQTTISVELDLWAMVDNWGVVLHRDGAPGFTRSRATAVNFYYAPAIAKYTWIDTDLEPGTYYYRAQSFSEDGNPCTYWSSVKWATVPA